MILRNAESDTYQKTQLQIQEVKLQVTDRVPGRALRCFVSYKFR